MRYVYEHSARFPKKYDKEGLGKFFATYLAALLEWITCIKLLVQILGEVLGYIVG